MVARKQSKRNDINATVQETLSYIHVEEIYSTKDPDKTQTHKDVDEKKKRKRKEKEKKNKKLKENKVKEEKRRKEEANVRFVIRSKETYVDRAIIRLLTGRLKEKEVWEREQRRFLSLSLPFSFHLFFSSNASHLLPLVPIHGT